MRKSADIRKSEIVEMVLVLADRIGPDRVTTAAVATAVGVTQAALFRHFPTKSSLWAAVAEGISARMATAWQEAIAGKHDPAAKLKALIDAQFGQIEQTPALPMLLFSRELNVDNEALREAFRGRLAAFHAMIRSEFVAGQNQSTFRAEIKADDAAVLMTSLVQGLAIRWSLGVREFNLKSEGQRLLSVNFKLFSTEGN